MTRQKTRELPGGQTVYEAGDCEFVSSSNGTVHRRDQSDSEEYEYEYHPACGQRLPENSMWSRVDADDAEEAVMKYNLVPCSKCIDHDLLLNKWRVDVHGATVIHNANTPDRWK